MKKIYDVKDKNGNKIGEVTETGGGTGALIGLAVIVVIIIAIIFIWPIVLDSTHGTDASATTGKLVVGTTIFCSLVSILIGYFVKEMKNFLVAFMGLIPFQGAAIGIISWILGSIFIDGEFSFWVLVGMVIISYLISVASVGVSAAIIAILHMFKGK